MYVRKCTSFCQVLKRCTQKIGSFFCLSAWLMKCCCLVAVETGQVAESPTGNHCWSLISCQFICCQSQQPGTAHYHQQHTAPSESQSFHSSASQQRPAFAFASQQYLSTAAQNHPACVSVSQQHCSLGNQRQQTRRHGNRQLSDVVIDDEFWSACLRIWQDVDNNISVVVSGWCGKSATCLFLISVIN